MSSVLPPPPPPLSLEPPLSSPPQAATPRDSAPMRQPVAANQREFKEPLLIRGLIWAAILRTPVPAEQKSVTKHGRLRNHGEPVGAGRWSGIPAVTWEVWHHEANRRGDDQHDQRDQERIERLGADRPQDDPDDEARDQGEEHAHVAAPYR